MKSTEGLERAGEFGDETTTVQFPAPHRVIANDFNGILTGSQINQDPAQFGFRKGETIIPDAFGGGKLRLDAAVGKEHGIITR